jgi:putative ABC transport system permease protein
MILTAFKFIKFDIPKSIGVLVGIIISVFLIGQQLGTLNFLMRLMGGIIENSNAQSTEIWVIDNTTNNVNVLTPIDQRLVQEIASIPGVAYTEALITAPATATFDNGRTASVTLVGSEGPLFPAGPLIAKITEGNLQDLNQSDAISAEFFSSKSLKVPLGLNQTFEINGKTAVVKVTTKNIQGFGGEYVYSSLDNVRFFANFSPSKVSAVGVKLTDDADMELIINQINSNFKGVKAWLKEDLRSSSVKEILSTSNMGISFGSLIVFASISGFFIIGLTLYSSALDRMQDYGTLKAMGATNNYVSRLILTQALLYAVAGFLIALLLLVLFKQGVENAGLIINLSAELILTLLGITLFISVGGSLFAVRKIHKLEPASVF